MTDDILGALDEAFSAQDREDAAASPFAIAYENEVARPEREAQTVGGMGTEFLHRMAGKVLGAGAMELADNAMKVASGQAGAVRPMPVIESVLANLFGGDRDVGAAVEESMGRAQGEAPYNPSSALVRSIAGGVAAKVRGTAMLDSLVRSPGGRFLEAGARGIQEATGTLSDDPVSKAAGAVTQGGMSMAEMLVPVPGYFWGSFFLQGAGSGAQEFEQAYEAGDVKGEQFSRPRQYAAAGIQGGIETVTEGVGGLIEMGFAKTVAGEFMERYAKRSLGKSIAVGLAGSMATEGAEEGIGSLATEYGRKPVTGERMEALPDALLNALSDAGYGSLGGVSGHAVGVAASVAQRKAQNEFISKALKERNSVYADPKFWEGIPGTTAAAISAMTPEERAAEIDARRSSSLKARGDIQAHELGAERIGTELADAERRLKAAKKRKDAKAEEEATNSIADLRRQGEEWGKDMAELRADREASDIAYHTAVAVAAREGRGWKPRTSEESLVENGAQATEPVTKGDMLVLDELTKLGYEVTFYGDDGSKDRTGYYDPSVPNRIFVRSGLEGASARLMIGSAYHEIIHAIQFTDARLWDAIRSSFDEQSLIASAVDYFRSGAEPEDFAAMAAAKDAVDYANEAAKAGSRARLPPVSAGGMDAIMRRYGGTLMETEGGAVEIEDGVRELFRSGRAPGLLGRIIARMGLRGQQAATALHVRDLLMKNASERQVGKQGVDGGQGVDTDLATRHREAKAGVAAQAELNRLDRASRSAPDGHRDGDRSGDRDGQRDGERAYPHIHTAQNKDSTAAQPEPPKAGRPLDASQTRPTSGTASDPSEAPAAHGGVTAAPRRGASGMFPGDASAARTPNFVAAVDLAAQRIRGKSPAWASGEDIHDIVAKLNSGKEHGLTPRQVQIGNRLMKTMEKALGPDHRALWARRRISLGLAPGEGSELAGRLHAAGAREINPAYAAEVVQRLAKESGVRLLAVAPGVGAYQGATEGALQVDASATMPQVAALMARIGHTLQQTEMVSSRAAKGGNGMALDFVHPSLAGRAEALRLFDAFSDIGPVADGAPLAPGFQQVRTPDGPAIRLLNLGGRWTPVQVKAIADAMGAAAASIGVEGIGSMALPIETGSIKNDWKELPNGEAYLGSLRDIEGPEAAARLAGGPHARAIASASRAADRAASAAKRGEAPSQALTQYARWRGSLAAEERGSLSARARAPLGANDEVRSVADAYMSSAGIAVDPAARGEYAEVDIPRAIALGAASEAAVHAPNDPEVVRTYDALARETLAQYDAIIAAGYRIEPWAGEGDPYPADATSDSSTKVIADIRDNRHLFYFRTVQDGAAPSFGESADADTTTEHPLLADSGRPAKGSDGIVRPQVFNDLFRAVHDFFGHAAEGFQFGARGEENAWRQHVRMYSEAARPAMTAETRMQNSWVNFGPHIVRADGSVPAPGDADYIAPQKRPYMEQKAFVPPKWASALDARRRPMKPVARDISYDSRNFGPVAEFPLRAFMEVHDAVITGARFTGDGTALIENLNRRADEVYHAVRTADPAKLNASLMGYGDAVKAIRQETVKTRQAYFAYGEALKQAEGNDESTAIIREGIDRLFRVHEGSRGTNLLNGGRTALKYGGADVEIGAEPFHGKFGAAVVSDRLASHTRAERLLNSENKAHEWAPRLRALEVIPDFPAKGLPAAKALKFFYDRNLRADQLIALGIRDVLDAPGIVTREMIEQQLMAPKFVVYSSKKFHQFRVAKDMGEYAEWIFHDPTLEIDEIHFGAGTAYWLITDATGRKGEHTLIQCVQSASAQRLGERAGEDYDPVDWMSDWPGPVKVERNEEAIKKALMDHRATVTPDDTDTRNVMLDVDGSLVRLRQATSNPGSPPRVALLGNGNEVAMVILSINDAAQAIAHDPVAAGIPGTEKYRPETEAFGVVGKSMKDEDGNQLTPEQSRAWIDMIVRFAVDRAVVDGKEGVAVTDSQAVYDIHGFKDKEPDPKTGADDKGVQLYYGKGGMIEMALAKIGLKPTGWYSSPEVSREPQFEEPWDVHFDEGSDYGHDRIELLVDISEVFDRLVENPLSRGTPGRSQMYRDQEIAVDVMEAARERMEESGGDPTAAFAAAFADELRDEDRRTPLLWQRHFAGHILDLSRVVGGEREPGLIPGVVPQPSGATLLFSTEFGDGDEYRGTFGEAPWPSAAASTLDDAKFNVYLTDDGKFLFRIVDSFEPPREREVALDRAALVDVLVGVKDEISYDEEKIGDAIENQRDNPPEIESDDYDDDSEHEDNKYAQYEHRVYRFPDGWAEQRRKLIDEGKNYSMSARKRERALEQAKADGAAEPVAASTGKPPSFHEALVADGWHHIDGPFLWRKGVMLEASEWDGGWHIGFIGVDAKNRKKGVGTEMMRSIMALADRAGMKLNLAVGPVAGNGGGEIMDAHQLVRWYTGLGFRPEYPDAYDDSGDFDDGLEMVRDPQKPVAALDARARKDSPLPPEIEKVRARAFLEGVRVARTTAQEDRRDALGIQRREMRASFAKRAAALSARIESAAEGNAELRRRLALQKRLAAAKRDAAAEKAEKRALKAWFAGQEKGSKEAARETRAEMIQMRRDAVTVISSLPTSMRWRYMDAVAEMRTPADIAAVAFRVVRDAAQADAIDTVRDIISTRRKVRKTGMRTETRALVNADLDSAFAMLATGRKRLLPMTDSRDLRARTEAARALHERAFDAFVLEREEYREGRDRMAEAQALDSVSLGTTLAKMPEVKQPEMAARPARKGLLGRNEFQNSDIYTIMQRMEGGRDGVLGRMWGSLTAAKETMLSARREIDREMDEAYRRAGYDGHEGYAAQAAGIYGDSSALVQEVQVGGRRRKVTIDQMLHLAAIDNGTAALLRDETDPPDIRGAPIVFRTNRAAAPIYFTKQEHAALVKSLSPQHDRLIEDMKGMIERRIRDRAFEIHFQVHGRQPDIEPGYFPRSRLSDEIGDGAIDINASSSALQTVMLSNAGFTKNRVSSKAPLLIGGMASTVDDHVSESLRLIHLSLPLRHAMGVLKSRPVRVGLQRVLGDGGNDGVRMLVLNGVGLSGVPRRGDLIDRINSNISGALITMAPKTWLRQLGGAFRLMSEMGLAANMEGIARVLAMSPSKRAARARAVEEANGYFYERHKRSQVGIFANVLGDPGKGREKWASALRAVGRSLARAGQDAAALRINDAARAVHEGSLAIGRLLRSADGVLRAIDRQIMLVAVEGYEARLRREAPRATDAELLRAASVLAEQAFRRTQNVSDPLDDTVFAAQQKFGNGALRMLFPFSSDPLKGFNQLRQAITTRDPKRIATTSAALGANIVWASAAGAAWTLGAEAIREALSGDDDDDEIVRQMLMERERKRAISSLAQDASASAAGYAGMVAFNIVDAAFAPATQSGETMEPLAVRFMGQFAKNLSGGHLVDAAANAAQMAGSPLVSPAMSTVKSAMPPKDSALLKKYRELDKAGALNAKQRERMAVLADRERQRLAADRAAKREAAESSP